MSQRTYIPSDLGRLLSMEPSAARQLFAQAQAAAVSGAKAEPRVSLAPGPNAGGGLYAVAGPVAVLSIDGPMMFRPGFIEWLMGAVPDELTCAALRQAADDPGTKATLVRLHSPGGTIAGNTDIVAAMEYHTARKPVYVVANDEACSKAMLIAGLATEFVATRSAMVGHIGSLWMGYDDSEMFKELGIEAKPAASTPEKAVGWPGVPVTPEVMANRQAWIDDNFAMLVDAVSKGRGVPDATVRGWRAAVFSGEQAVKVGLASKVVDDCEAYMADLVARHSKATPVTGGGRPGSGRNVTPERKRAMTIAELREQHPEAVAQIETAAVNKYKAEHPEAPKAEAPASFADLSAAFSAKPGGKEFIFDAQVNGLSLSAAQNAWAAKVEAENADLRAKVAEAAKPPSGSPPVPQFTPANPASSQAQTGRPETYAAAVKAIEAADRVKRPVAMARAQKQYPDLHAAWSDAGFPKID